MTRQICMMELYAKIVNEKKVLPLRKKCPYLELFWFVFPRIRTEYEEILRISPYSVRMQENTDENNSEYRHFLRSVFFKNTRSQMFYRVLNKLLTKHNKAGIYLFKLNNRNTRTIKVLLMLNSMSICSAH